MRRTLLIAALCVAALIAPGTALAAKAVKLHFFHSVECPHCQKEKAFLDVLKQKHPELEVISHEVTRDVDEAKLFVQMSRAYGTKVTGVPATFIGHFQPIIGFQGEDTTGKLIESRIKYCAESGCIDPTEKVIKTLLEPTAPGDILLGEPSSPAEDVCPDNVPCVEGEAGKTTTAKTATQAATEAPKQPAVKAPEKPAVEASKPSAEIKALSVEETVPPPAEDDIVSLPLIGRVDASKMALPVLTLVIAGMDGFNPCAFFVLFTLLGMLVHVHSRSRMLLVGGIFVFFSGLIYFLFMAAWLNIFLFAGTVRAITVAAGIVALVIAVINVKEFFFFHRGVSLNIPDSAKPKLFDRMRKLLKATSLSSVIAGTVVLAVAANTYELLCTAGFPMVFTRVLTLHKLSSASYYLYLALYNVIYVVPLAVIVGVFTATLGSRKLSEHQGQVLKLVSGVMMLYLAVVILVKPGLLGNVLVAAGLLAASLVTSALVMLLSKALHRRKD